MLILLSHNNFLTISAYTPTLLTPEEMKTEFYSQLSGTQRNILNNDKILLPGDFSACTGDDYTAWNGVAVKCGHRSLNTNGELLLTFCTEFDLAVTNTFFNRSEK